MDRVIVTVMMVWLAFLSGVIWMHSKMVLLNTEGNGNGISARR